MNYTNINIARMGNYFVSENIKNNSLYHHKDTQSISSIDESIDESIEILSETERKKIAEKRLLYFQQNKQINLQNNKVNNKVNSKVNSKVNNEVNTKVNTKVNNKVNNKINNKNKHNILHNKPRDDIDDKKYNSYIRDLLN